MASKSAFAMKHRFELNDGTEFEVESSIVDVVRFERAENTAYLDADTANIKMSTLMWVGWAAACRAKKINDKAGRAKFEMFLPLVADYEPIFEDPEDDDEPGSGESDPTQPDPQPEN
ncbi:hypothetical protein [Microlunatus parietis]|uniref:Uncharacterized protein n=1 Tax=Microlunatus parietis TaxID=682979 RepID=A0A7Y9L9J5_9ACTN|nr:hypothetical protein [Microlunatus parietis]NYE68863.1 hypothetical protein [Microlunatus parietis]